MSAKRLPGRAAVPGAPADEAGSAFEASAFESSLGGAGALRALGWRRRALVLLALLGCLGVFVLAHGLAAAPDLAARWQVGPSGALRLAASPNAALQAMRGRALLALAASGGPESPASALLLHRLPQWQVDDDRRARQVAEQRGLAQALAQAGVGGELELRFDDGTRLSVPVVALGWAGLGPLFWPLALAALLLYLVAAVLLLARPRPGTLLFSLMALCQSASLLLMAAEGAGTLGHLALPGSEHLAWRIGLDLATGAALVHAFALHPRRLPRARAIALAAWAVLPLWAALVALAEAGWIGHLWWWGRGACLTLGAAAWAVIDHSQRIEPHPYARVMRRFAAAALAGLLLTTGAVLLSAATPRAALVSWLATVAWRLLVAALLLLTPFLARSGQLLREFGLLAAVSAAATALDLLFAALLSLGPFASLAFAVFAALGLYAGARQWLIGRLLGRQRISTERGFDLVYRAARQVQLRPERYAQLLGQLLRDLFEPLALHAVDRVPPRARVTGGGAALVVPLRADDEPATALQLRFAQRGRRLFTPDDARLAEQVVDQLRRARAHDQAVERGRTEERQRIAQDLHDDIGARLLTLMYRAPTPELEEYIRHTLQDLKTLTRGLSATDHRLTHTGAEWKADLTQRLGAADATLGWSFSHDRDLRLTVVQWSALTRVLRELVSNALYHGHARQIDVQFSLEGRRLALRVADDGDGRAPEAWAHGLGLGGVRKRVKALGGTVAWRENPPRGIVCEVTVEGFEARA